MEYASGTCSERPGLGALERSPSSRSIYAQEDSSRWLSSLNTFAETVPVGLRARMGNGSPAHGAEQAGGEGNQLWGGRTQVALPEMSLMLSRGRASSFGLQCVWSVLGLRLHFRGDSEPAS